jgi:hypothetical protein
VKQHPHIATPYELRAAAQQRLTGIVFPAPKHPATWATSDHLYLQERWCKAGDIYFVESTTPEAENIGWQPANTMPLEAVEHWFTIIEVQAMQIQDVSSQQLFDSGLTEMDPMLAIGKTLADVGIETSLLDLQGLDCADFVRRVGSEQHWNRAYPAHRWECDRWVIVLALEAIAA